MFILGLNAYHGDASAAIYNDNVLIAATEEERIRRIKHWAGLPTEAIKFCLAEAGIGIEQLDYITVSRDPFAKIGQKLVRTLKNIVSGGGGSIKERAANSMHIKNIKSDIADAMNVDVNTIKAKVEFVEHHRCHLASAFYVSPFDEAAIVSIDGFGDFTSSMTATGKGLQMEVLDSVSYPHSLGIFYTTFTQLLGFNNFGDEYKVMGLAPYGKPTLTAAVRDTIELKDNGKFELKEKYFKHFVDGIQMEWKGGSPTIDPLYNDILIEKFGKIRTKDEPLSQYHMDMAHSVQCVCEETIFHILNHVYQKTGLKNLCLAGGVAQNSVANGKITTNTPFENVFIPPAGHDAGTSVGSALYFIHQKQKIERTPFAYQAYTGAKFTNLQIEEIVKAKGLKYEVLKEENLFDQVSTSLQEGKVVGWFQGRAEFGPRALGDRSILVDPSRSDAKDLLNSKIKRRESFRPFAPSILAEYVDEYFEINDRVPFMEKVFKIRENKRQIIPAVTHVDGTGRLQTVDIKTNFRYYSLIEAFRKKSGVPILLNTSFNENEPIVNTPQEALDCFLRTDMDLLVMQDVVVRR